MFNIDNHIQTYNNYYYNFLQITLSNLPAHMCPLLQFGETNECYTDSNIIHIGKGFVQATEEEEAIMEILYVLGHEAQHVVSSPRKFWEWGQTNGLRVLVSELSRLLLGFTVEDCKQFCNEANKHGYKFSEKGLMELVHFIFNSIEDGRIERIRCAKSKLFRNEMYVYRGRYWSQNTCSSKMPELMVIINQILALATIGVYQKDYPALYAGTTLDDFIDSLIPDIAKAVNARSCYDCAIAITGIYQAIAPYVLAYFKSNDENKMRSEMKKTGQTGSGEHQNSYSGPSNMEEKAKENGAKQSANTEAPGLGQNSKSDKSKKSSCATGDGKQSNKKDGKNKDDKEGNDSKTNNTINSASNDISLELKDNLGRDRIDTSGLQLKTLSDAEINAMINTMREQAKEALAQRIKDVKSYGARKVPTITEVFDTSKPVEPLKNSTCSQKFNFKELKRQYGINLEMPQHLAQRANAFARKLEKIFKQNDISLMGKSGSIDGKELHKLLIGELDFFKREEESKELDVCCYFLCDNSGSMGSGPKSKRDYALQTLSVIEEGFKQYMPLKITAFQSTGDTVIHECVKNWEERYNKSCSFNYLEHTHSGCRNADGYSIRIATNELMTRPESMKILFVLSDGCPAYRNGEADTALAAKEARDKGIILIPIYFSTETCKDGSVNLNTEEAKIFAGIYKKDMVITVPERIEENVVRILEKLVISQL